MGNHRSAPDAGGIPWIGDAYTAKQLIAAAPGLAHGGRLVPN